MTTFNINTPSSNIALLGNQIPMTSQQILARPLLNSQAPQAKALLLGMYINLLQSSLPSYAFNSWSSPAYGFGQTPSAIPSNAPQQLLYPFTRQPYQLNYPQYYPIFRI